MELMSERQWKRWDAIGRVNAEKLTMKEGAQLGGVSLRQLRRMRRRVAEVGQAALLHGNTGRRPVNRVDTAVRERVVTLRRGKYDRFNDQHFCEKLRNEAPPILLGVRTVRRILRAAGIASVRRRRPRAHRRRRERKAQAGLMLLWDGSPHDWLEQRGPKLCLIGAIDDATSEVMPGAHFVEQECAAGYLRTLKAIVSDLGVPWSIYMDQHGSLKRNDSHWTFAEELRGRQDPTQVGMALEALEIQPIYALSPQAKGRVERMWWTFQDRLVSELRLAGATTASEATATVERYRVEHNEKFAVSARDRAPAWRPLRRGVDIDRICSFRYEATVSRDNAVRLAGMVIDIAPGPRNRSYADKRVEVRHLLDGSWRVYDADHLIAVGPSTSHGELRTLRRKKKARRQTSATAPEHAIYGEASP
jgi:hypothetical protein